MNVAPYKECLSISNKLHRLWWNICCALFFRPLGGPLFRKWRSCLLRAFGAKIGRGCAISASAKIWAPWNLHIGEIVAIGPRVKLYNPGMIVLGDKVTVSQDATLCAASHDITHPLNPLVTAPITLERFSWVAAEAFVGMGVTVGEGAVVGARAAVFKDVEPWTVVGGNPAKVIKKRVIQDA